MPNFTIAIPDAPIAGDLLFAHAVYRFSVNGLRVAVFNANRRGGIHNRLISIATINRSTFGSLYTPTTIGPALQQYLSSAEGANTTALFGLIGGANIEAAIPTLENHSLFLFGEASAGVSIPPSRQVLVTRPTTAFEALELVEIAVTRKFFRRIAIAASFEDAFAEFERRLAEFNYTIASRFVLPIIDDDPSFSYTAQWQALVAGAPNAIIIIGTPSSAAEQLISDCMATAPWMAAGHEAPQLVIASSFLSNITTAILGTQPNQRAANGATVVVAGRTPSASDATSPAAALFRQEYDSAHAAGITENNVTALLAIPGASPRVFAAWTDAQVMIQALGGIGAHDPRNISREDVSPAVLRRVVYTVGEMNFGMFYDMTTDCALCGTSTTTQNTGTICAPCMCTTGARQLLTEEYSPHSAATTLLLQRVPLLTCNASSKTISHSLAFVNTIAPGGNLSTAAPTTIPMPVLDRVFEPYAIGNLFGPSQLPLVQALVPNVTKGYAHAASVRHFLLAMGPLVDLPLATLDSDAHTPALRTTRDAVVSMLTLQPLPVLPRLLPSRFQRYVVSVLPPLEAEMSAVAQHIFARGRSDGARSSTVQRTFVNIAPAHVISVIADSDGGVADPGTNFSTFVSTADLGILPLGPERLAAMGIAFERACGRSLVRVAATVLLPFRPSQTAPSSLLAEWLQSTTVAPVEASVFLAGLTSSPTDGEVPALLTFLQRNPRASVYLPFSTLAMHYEALLATLNTSAAAATNATDRVFVASGIPHWAPLDASDGAQPLPAGVEEESYYGQFLHATADPLRHQRQRTPLALLGALMAAYAGAIIARIAINERILPSAILAEVYESVVVNLYDGFDVMGPFYDVACSTQNELHVRCEQNYPTSRLLRVMPLAVAFGARSSGTVAGGPVDTLAVVADDLYSPQWALPSNEDSELLSLRVILFIAFTCFLVLVILAVLLACLLRRRVREAMYAPSDPSRPFTIVFTDIQSSTTLWAELPEMMGPGLDFHHMTIRALLKKHRGYEVKTVGDSFMIAFKCAADAVKFSDEMQRVFFAHEWGGDDFDQCIREIEAQLAELREAEGADPSEYAMLTCYLSEEAYRNAWRGLRVRVGIHTGVGEIKLDEVTKAYDYYGTVVNTAARIESCAYGGQVIVSDATRKAMSAEMESDNATTTTTQTTKKIAAVADAYGFGTPSSETSSDAGKIQQGQFRYRDLGFASLRGLATPVSVLQLETVPGRNFGPLRDAGKTALEDDDDDDLSGEADSHDSTSEMSSFGTTTDSSHKRVASPEVTRLVIARLVTFVMQTLLSTTTPKVRCDMLKAFCKHWRVNVNVNQFAQKQERMKERLKRRAERLKRGGGGDQTPRPEEGDSGRCAANTSDASAVPEALRLPTLRNVQFQSKRRHSTMEDVSAGGDVQMAVAGAETPRERNNKEQWAAPYLYAVTKKIASVITAHQRQQAQLHNAETTSPAIAAANADGYEMSLASANSSKSGAMVSFEGLVACVHDVLCQRTPHHAAARGGLGHRLSDVMGSSHGGLESVTFASQHNTDSSGAHARRQSHTVGRDRVRNFSRMSVSSEGGPLKPPSGLQPPLPSSGYPSADSSPRNGSRGSIVGFPDGRGDEGTGIHIPEVLVVRPLPAFATATGARARIAAAHGMRNGYDHLPAPTPSMEAATQQIQRLLVREYRSLLPEAAVALWERQHKMAKADARRDGDNDTFSTSSNGSSGSSGTDGGGVVKKKAEKNRHWTDRIRTLFTVHDHGMRDPWQHQHLPAATASDEEAMTVLRTLLSRSFFGKQTFVFLNNREGSDAPTQQT